MSDQLPLLLPCPNLESIAVPITAPIPEGPVDILPGFLPKNGQTVLAGETNIGKSLVALEVCSSLATGRPLWGEVTPTGKARKILYVLGEHNLDVIQRLWQVTRLPMTDQIFLLGPEQLGYDKWLVSQGKPNFIAVNKFKRWMDGVDLVVFDPFSAFVTGIDVENDNIQMRLVLDTMSLIAQSVGASCLVLAHQGKPTIDQKTGQERARKSYAIRGASAIEDAATNIFYMSRGGSSEAASKVAEGQLFTLTRRKYKGIAPPEYGLLREPTTLCHTLLGHRPYADLQTIVMQAKVGRMQAAFPGMPYGDVLKAVSAMTEMNVETIRRYLGGR